jgi:hypothetical protein
MSETLDKIWSLSENPENKKLSFAFVVITSECCKSYSSSLGLLAVVDEELNEGFSTLKI